MSKKLFLFLVFNLFFIPQTFCKELDEIGLFLGMSMSTYAEEQSSLKGDALEEPASGGSSSIASELYYKFFHRPTYSLYAHTFFPLLSSGDSSIFSGGMGLEYYFTNVNSRISEEKDFLNIYISPKITYFALAELNALSLTYTTPTSKKIDVGGEIALGGGLSYSLGQRFGGTSLRASALAGRGVGVVTSTINIRFFMGLVYFI